MFAIVTLLFGAVVGAAGTTAWLLSEPDGTLPATPSPGLDERLQVLQTRFKGALAEGQAAGHETEARLRSQLDQMRNRGKPTR
ncbi:MAG TPA: hypothetical protein VKX16_19190 [Chloroflexota bacterium]|nr:hypothetical protein [Chloroflexota bacterium]